MIKTSDPFWAALLGIRAGPTRAPSALASAVLAPSDYSELDDANGGGGGGGGDAETSTANGAISPGEIGDDTADEAGNPFATDLKLTVAMPQASVCTVVGMLTISFGVLSGTSNAPLFFTLLSTGALALCTTTAGVNMAIMAAVNPESRSFAIGMGTLLVHAVGDVPAPPIIGALAESLSPQTCVPSSSVGAALARSRIGRVLSALRSVAAPGALEDPAQTCTRDAHGLEITLVAVTMWLIWPVLLWAVAWLIAERRSLERRAQAAANAGRALGGQSRFLAFLDTLKGLRPLTAIGEAARNALNHMPTMPTLADIAGRYRSRTQSPETILTRADDATGISLEEYREVNL